MGWLSVSQVFLVNYDCSMSSGHAAHTRIIAYSGVPEEAAPLLVAAQCHLDYTKFLNESIVSAITKNNTREISPG
jgi:hypothetical protein